MKTIVMYEPLRAMVVWAAIAAGCSLVLAVEAGLTLAVAHAPLRWVAGLTSVGVNLGAFVLLAGLVLLGVTLLRRQQALPGETSLAPTAGYQNNQS